MKIEIEHVSKKIKDALVLDDVCMTLESGNIYGFQGVNGSGKKASITLDIKID